MSCVRHCRAMAEHFGSEAATDDLDRYRKKGPDATTAAILEAIRSTSRHYASLLDIGAGVGVLHHELLGSLVDRTVHVEASPAYIKVAREEDVRCGHEGRVDYVLGDATDVMGDVRAADLVTLDRVICCYPDWPRLVRISASKATKVLAFSIPRDRWYTRLGVRLANFVRAVRGNTFRAYVHPVAEIEGALVGLGFQQVRLRRTFTWHIALFELIDSTVTESAA